MDLPQDVHTLAAVWDQLLSSGGRCHVQEDVGILKEAVSHIVFKLCGGLGTLFGVG